MITYEDLLIEMERLRIAVPKYEISEQQIEFLKKARENINPLSWRIIRQLWKKMGWGNPCENTLTNYYLKYCQ